MDLDELLNLEQKFYQEGYQEGQKENLKQNFLEGKQYGLQIGYQRFHLLGVFYGLCQYLMKNLEDSSEKKNIVMVTQMIQALDMDNKQESVEFYERSIFKIRNKFRLILMNLQKETRSASLDAGYNITLQMVESLAKELAGEVQGYHEENDDTSVNIRDQSNDW